MANAIIALVVPGIDNTIGPPTDVSTVNGTFTVEISGPYQGSYTVLGSQDGNLYVPLLIFDSGAGVQAFKQTITTVVKFMKVKRNATAITSMSVAGETTATNQFLALAPVLANTQTGPLPSIDVWALVAPTGYDNGFTALGAGDMVGTIALEGSLDGVQFSPLGSFYASPRDPNASAPVFSPIVVADTVRFIRLNVMPGTYIAGPVSVTIGGNQITGGGAPFPGFGGPPPPVGPVNVTGVAATVSHSDHTHQGVHSVNTEVGDVVLESIGATVTITTPDANHVNFEVATPFPGLSGPPPSVGTTNVTGVAATASHSDHAHQGVHSLNTEVGDVVLESAGATIAFTFPDATHINLEVTNLGRGTLASIYAYGLSDVPATDNLFAMPSGVLAFPGNLHGYDGSGSAISWVGSFLTSSPPFYERIENPIQVGAAGSSPFFHLVMDASNWNGTFSQDDVSFLVEQLTLTNKATPVTLELGQRYYQPYGGPPYAIPASPGGLSETESLYLYNSGNGLVHSRDTDGNGLITNYLYPNSHGVTAAFLTRILDANLIGSWAAGDGPAWIVDPYGTGGFHEPHAAWQAYMQTSSSIGAWGWRAFAFDGAALQMVLDMTPALTIVNSDLEAHSYIFDNEDSTTYPVGPATKAKLIWDDTLGKFMVSKDTNPYVPLFTATVMTYNWSLLTSLSTGQESGGNLTTVWIPGNPGNAVVGENLYGGTGTDVAHYVSSVAGVYRNGTFYVFQAGNQGTSARLDTAYVEVVAAIPLAFISNMEYVVQLWRTTDVTNAAAYTLLASGNIDITGAGGLTDNQVTLEATGPANPTINNGDRLFLAVFRSDSGGSTLSELLITASARFIPVP